MNLCTPSGNRTSAAWTLYELATATKPLTAHEIRRRRSQRVYAVKPIWGHLGELMVAGYVSAVNASGEETKFEITDAGRNAERYWRVAGAA